MTVSTKKPLANKIALAFLLIFPLSASVQAQECTYLTGPADAGEAIAASGSTGVSKAWYGDATTDYAHGVLGDTVEANVLYAEVQGKDTCAAAIRLPGSSVFEDVTPRIGDVTGDGVNDVVVIESHRELGASLAIYGTEEGQLLKLASTPYIGRAFRWLAPVGIADFTGDNIADVAYVETPHIGGILKIWSFANEVPELVVAMDGFSNHRIGENTITGGIRHCGDGVEMVLPDTHWENTLIARYRNKSITTEIYANDTSADTVQRALQCK
ncbi:hypothetical protein AB833_18955 [Chromatiales bacterium (ex Bugula neritina AB1)]|nr:hypothetical protein AB833_18955 [Chromatiales bacterium (ex Bugula neritina AB1)]